MSMDTQSCERLQVQTDVVWDIRYCMSVKVLLCTACGSRLIVGLSLRISETP